MAFLSCLHANCPLFSRNIISKLIFLFNSCLGNQKCLKIWRKTGHLVIEIFKNINNIALKRRESL